jgi:hypothetical protein
MAVYLQELRFAEVVYGSCCADVGSDAVSSKLHFRLRGWSVVFPVVIRFVAPV